MTSSAAFPIDPEATPEEQQLLDQFNAISAALELMDAGERITGTRHPATRAKLERQAAELVDRARRLRP